MSVWLLFVFIQFAVAPNIEMSYLSCSMKGFNLCRGANLLVSTFCYRTG